MSSLEDEKLWYLCLFGVPYAVVVGFEVVGLECLVGRVVLHLGMQSRGSYCRVFWFPWVVRISFVWSLLMGFGGLPPGWGLGVVFQVESCFYEF